ncbi:MAG: phage terminase large subunit family protein [Burkholderiales bacterium]|nr:phage terminase large subunit family protein [Burkholderiales bacterium]
MPYISYKQLTAEYRTSLYKNGRKVSRWEKKQADRNEALDLMVYNLAAAYHLGLHKRTEGQWQRLREKLNPLNQDMFVLLEAEQGAPVQQPQDQTGSSAPTTPSTIRPVAGCARRRA